MQRSPRIVTIQPCRGPVGGLSLARVTSLARRIESASAAFDHETAWQESRLLPGASKAPRRLSIMKQSSKPNNLGGVGMLGFETQPIYRLARSLRRSGLPAPGPATRAVVHQNYRAANSSIVLASLARGRARPEAGIWLVHSQCGRAANPRAAATANCRRPGHRQTGPVRVESSVRSKRRRLGCAP